MILYYLYALIFNMFMDFIYPIISDLDLSWYSPTFLIQAFQSVNYFFVSGSLPLFLTIFTSFTIWSFSIALVIRILRLIPFIAIS